MFDHVPPQLPSRVPTRLAFVGEAPAEEELQDGQPLVGPSGRTFNSILQSANMDRKEFLITNLFDEDIPNDKAIELWAERGELYQRNCARLVAELDAAGPVVVVPLGSPALFAFTGLRSGIMQNRGAVLQASAIRPGQKIVPTFHPAFVLRQWQYFTVVLGDIIRAARQADLGPGIIHPNRELLLEPTIQDIKDYMPRLLSSSLLSVDIETSMGQITDIGFAPDPEHAINIPFWDERRPDRNYWPHPVQETAAWGLVREVMESPVPKLGQNFGAYDAVWLLDKYGIRTMNLLHDTRLLHHALYPELPKSLAFMGASYTLQGNWKSWGKTKQDKRDD